MENELENEPQIQKKPKSNALVITILILLLIGAIFFIGRDFYSDKIKKVEREIKEECNQNITTSFEQGITQGGTEIVAIIMQTISDCSRNPLPLTLLNQTVSIVNMECLQR